MEVHRHKRSDPCDDSRRRDRVSPEMLGGKLSDMGAAEKIRRRISTAICFHVQEVCRIN